MTSEAVQRLCEYIRIDTTNPPGNESAAADFLAGMIEGEGIECRRYEPKPGRISIRAVIPGTGEKDPLILLNHMDVVPADAGRWSFDPFGGEIRDGFVCGRGALDMKSLGIMELMAFLHMQRQKFIPCRDLVFLAVADEETGGTHGAEYLLEHHEEDFRAGLILNEGGLGLQGLLAEGPVHMISTAEKGPCWMKLTRTGSPGHGSMPHGDNALENLSSAIQRLLSAEKTFTVTPVVAEYFRRLASGWDFLQPFVHDGKSETLIELLHGSGLMGMPEISAMLQNTVSLNMLHAGEKTNVIPDRAVARIDARLLPGQGIESFVTGVRTLLADDAVQVETVTPFPSTASPFDSNEFLLLTEILQNHFPDSVVTPSLSAGTTDSRFFRQKGIDAFGFFPIVVPLADIKTVHGIDEKISVENMDRGTRIFTEAVRALCTS